MDYLSVKAFAEKHGVSDRYIRRLCAEGKLEAERAGKEYRIPETSELPADRRHLRGKVVAEHLAPLFAALDEKKAELKKRRPFPPLPHKKLGQSVRIAPTFCFVLTKNAGSKLRSTAKREIFAQDKAEKGGILSGFPLLITQYCTKRSALRLHNP